MLNAKYVFDIPVSVRFMLLKMLQYSITTSFSSFVLAYLKSERMLNDSQASLLLMLNTIGAFAGQFIAGRCCDYFRTHKKVFFAVCILLVPVALVLYNVQSVRLICVFYLLVGCAQIPFTVVIDTWFMDTFPGDTGTYGKMLASGAVAYAVLSVSYGKLLDTVGYGIMPWCLTALVLLSAALAATIPDTSILIKPRKAEVSSTGKFNGALVMFLVSLMMIGICGNTYSLLPVLMENVNGSNVLLGLAMSSSGIFQIPFMLISGKLKRIPACIRVAIAGSIYLTMVLLFTFGRSPWPLIIGAGISGGAWGVMLPAYRELVGELAVPEYRSTAQGLADALYLSMGAALASGFVSLTSGIWGMQIPLLIIAAVQVAAIVMLITANRQRT